jgi:pimeloyl-ACP methyl ester carboxylesterase
MSRWKNALLSGGAAIGVAAAFNALALRNIEPIENTIGGEQGWFEWRGYRIAYTKRGSGPALMLVHSIHAAAFSFEWRFNVDELARHYTVYTIDLLGFGCSDRPNVRYSARLYTTLIADAVAQLVGGPCVLVASSLSAAYSIILGARDPERFPALVLIEPTGLVRLNRGATTGGEMAQLTIDSPVLGTAVFNALVSKRSLRYHLERVYRNDELVTDDIVAAYYVAAHQPGAKYAPSAFLSGHLNIDVRHALRRLRQPTLVVWGEHAVDTPVEDARGFLSLKQDLRLEVIEGVGSLPHDERPARFNELLLGFVRDSLNDAG